MGSKTYQRLPIVLNAAPEVINQQNLDRILPTRLFVLPTGKILATQL
jgi:hypothetical protein